MKPQDILFILILIGLLVWRKPKMLVWVSLVCLFVSIPLFYRYVFFTAERLVMYAAGFLLVAVILLLIGSFKRD